MIIISLSIDDCPSSTMLVMYEMRKYGWTGTVGVVTSWIDQPTFLSLDDVHTLVRNGWEIASKTVDDSILTSLSDTDLINELNQSKQFLINNGFNVTTIIYPFTYNDARVQSYARLYYNLARGGTTSTNCAETDKTAINAYDLKACDITKVEMFKSSLEIATNYVNTNPGKSIWLNFYFHRLVDYRNLNILTVGCMKATQSSYILNFSDFEKMLSIISEQGLSITTIANGYNQFMNLP